MFVKSPVSNGTTVLGLDVCFYRMLFSLGMSTFGCCGTYDVVCWTSELTQLNLF